MKSKLRSYAITAAKIAFAGGLIFWIFKRGGIDWNALKGVLAPIPFLGLGVLSILGVLVANLRWQVLLRGQSFDVGFRDTFPLTLIGMFFNYAMPGSVGGDLVKGYYLARDFSGPHATNQNSNQTTNQVKVAAGVSVFMDRLIGFFVMMLSASLAIIAFYDRLKHDSRLLAIGTGTLLITFGFFVVLAFALSRRLQRPLRFFAQFSQKLPGHAVLENIYRAMHSYRYRPADVFLAMGLSMINQVLIIAFFWFTAQIIGETQIPLSTFWFCVPIGLVVQAVPLAPAGVGVGQAAFFFLFQATLQSSVQAGTIGITLLQGFQFLMGLFGAALYLKRGPIEISQ